MSIQTHIQRRDNPHNVTLTQINLDQLLPYPLATQAEIMALTRDDRYIDATATQWIRDAFVKYLQDLGLADADGNLIRRDISGTIYAHIDETDQLIVSGTAMGGVRADYEVLEDGQSFLTGSFTFQDHYRETIAGSFNSASVYMVRLTVYKADDSVMGEGEVTVFDTRTQDDGFFDQDASGFLYYDQRYFANWDTITTFTDIDGGLLSQP